MLLRCYFAFVLPILEYCYPVWGSAAECHLQLLERVFIFFFTLCPDQSFLMLCHRRRVAGLICCTRLMPTVIIVCSASFHLLLLEFDILELRSQLIHWSLKYQDVEPPNLQGVSWRPRFECGMTFPTLRLTPERCMGSRAQSPVGCFSKLCLLQFSVVHVFVGLRK